jgi:hypothetical protein
MGQGGIIPHISADTLTLFQSGEGQITLTTLLLAPQILRPTYQQLRNNDWTIKIGVKHIFF